MGELKAMHSDVTKNAADLAAYDAEFHDLMGQVYNLALTEFNGIRVIGDLNNAATGVGGTTGNGLGFGDATGESAATHSFANIT